MVADREQAGRMIGRSALALKLSGITVKGRRVNVQSSIIGVEAKKSQGRDTARKNLIGAGSGASSMTTMEKAPAPVHSWVLALQR